MTISGAGSATETLRRRTTHPRRRAGHVPLPSGPVRLQQTPARVVAADQTTDPDTGHRYRSVDRPGLGGRLDTGRVRPLPTGGEAIEPGRERPATATAPATPGSSGACGYTWSPHPPACPSPDPWPPTTT